MHKYIALAFISLSSIQGCGPASSNLAVKDYEMVDLAGNGEARTLDFLDPIYPLRGNQVSVRNSETTLAVTQWEDLTRCFTHSDWNRGELQACPGRPSTKLIKLLGAECEQNACEVTDVSGSHFGNYPYQISLYVKLKAPSARLHVRVQDVEARAVREDWYLLQNDRL
jgi:hypothetical protein